MFFKRLAGFIARKIFFIYVVLVTAPKRILFSFLSWRVNKKGYPTLFQPGLFSGKGKIIFGKEVKFGFNKSPSFYSSYAYLEARGKNAKIEFHDNIWCNNNFAAIADDTSITISENCYIGANVEIFDSNFHDLRVDKRRGGTDPNPLPVFIGKNVYIGNSVKILKGVTIGDNSVIGNGSVVVQSIPANVIALGNPCRVFGKVEE